MCREDDQALLVRLSGIRQNVHAALVDYVRRVTTAHGAALAAIILYGSQARGDARDQSDIDLLILIRQDSPALRQALTSIAWEVQFEHNLIISDIMRSLDEWAHMQEMQFPFYQNIKQEGITLWKNAYEPWVGCGVGT